MVQMVVVVPSMELGVQTALLIFKLFGGEEQSGASSTGNLIN
jgi:hypothetical protein